MPMLSRSMAFRCSRCRQRWHFWHLTVARAPPAVPLSRHCAPDGPSTSYAPEQFVGAVAAALRRVLVLADEAVLADAHVVEEQLAGG